MKPRELHGEWTPKGMAITAVVVVVVILAGRWGIAKLFSSGETHAATTRIEQLFDGLRTPTGSDLSLNLWFGGRVPTDIDSLNHFGGMFEKWCADHGLNPVKTYKIKDATETAEKDALGAPVVLVSGTVNDRPFRIRVQRGQMLTWVD